MKTSKNIRKAKGKTFIIFFVLGFFAVSTVEAQNEGRQEVMFVGFAHLSQLMNGTPEADIFSEKKQTEIQDLVESLKEFGPTAIMVELEPGEQKWNDSLYGLFKENKLDLRHFEYGAGETFQIGFKLGKELDLEKIYGIDYNNSTSQSLLHKGKNIDLYLEGLKKLQAEARPLNQQVQKDSMSIYDFIRRINEPDMIKLTHHLLFNLPAYVTEGDFDKDKLNGLAAESIDKEYIGAEFISLFYNRNLKIYSNILRAQQQSQAKRIMVIIGQAHVGVLQELFRNNPEFLVVSPLDHLKEHNIAQAPQL